MKWAASHFRDWWAVALRVCQLAPFVLKILSMPFLAGLSLLALARELKKMYDSLLAVLTNAQGRIASHTVDSLPVCVTLVDQFCFLHLLFIRQQEAVRWRRQQQE